MINLKKSWKVLREMIILRFHGLMVFRLDFFGPFFVDGSLFVIELLAFAAVYSNVETIGNWGQGEMILYIGTFSLLNALNMTIFFFGVNGIPDKIKSGELDLYLTKPISPLFRLTFENISPGSIPLIIMSIVIIIYGVDHIPVKISASNVAAYCFWSVVMTILYYDMEVLVRSVSLYIVSTARMDQLEDAGLSLCMRLPGIALYGIYKIIFYFFMPYGIMATLPVQSMIGEMTLIRSLYGITIVVFFSIITRTVWQNGLKHYNSASS